MAEVEVMYADALRQHIVASLDEVLAASPDDPFKALQKSLFAASLEYPATRSAPPPVAAIALKWLSSDEQTKEYAAKFGALGSSLSIACACYPIACAADAVSLTASLHRPDQTC